MRRKFKLVILLVFSFDLGCKSINNKSDTSRKTTTYNNLMVKSNLFLKNLGQQKFISNLQYYIDTCSEYSFDTTRSAPSVLFPILVNNDQNKAITLVLNRSSGISGAPIEYVKFVSGLKKDSNWTFKLKKGHTSSFSYAHKHPIMSDSTIAQKVIFSLLQHGYIKKDMEVNDSLFTTDLYVL